MGNSFHRFQLLLAIELIFCLPRQVGSVQTGTSDEFHSYLPFLIAPAEGNQPPNMPSNPSPAGQAAGQPVTNLTLSWSGADPDGDSVTYSIYLDANSSNPTNLVSAGQSATQYKVSSLLPATSYSWRVVARNSKGATTSGPVWRFTTMAVEPLPIQP